MQAKNGQLQELEDLPSQLQAMEEVEENLRRELEEVQSQLVAIQHEAAMLRSKEHGQQQLQELEEELEQLRRARDQQQAQVCDKFVSVPYKCYHAMQRDTFNSTKLEFLG